MTDPTIRITKADELFVRVDADNGILYELSEHFSYYVEGYKFMAAYKSGSWDGKIKLFNARNRTIYSGLISDIKKFANRYEYSIEIDDGAKPINTLPDLKAFVKTIPDIAVLEPYSYQMEAFAGALIENKSIVLSPTASGKSFMIYLIVRFLMEYVEGKILVVVPSISLVDQMVGDFTSYDPQETFDELCHKIRSGASKETEESYRITLEDGSQLTMPGSQLIKTINRGDISIKDLTSHDEVDDAWIKRNIGK